MRAQLALLVGISCVALGCKKSDKATATAAGSGSAASRAQGGSASAVDGSGSVMATMGSAGSATGSAAAPTAGVTSASLPEADPAKAKAANARGYKLYTEKKYKEAAVEYRSAIAADPSFLVAHYNLACAASLAKDQDTALKELAWLADRSAWDEKARPAAAKSRTDRDLQWIRDSDQQGFILTGTDTADNGAVDVLDWVAQRAQIGTASNDPNVAKTLASAPGKHEEACSSAAFVAKAFDSKGQAAANLRDGVALLDDSGNVRVRSEPLGCSSPGDHVTAFNQLASIGSPLDISDPTLYRTHLFVVQYAAGNKQKVSIFLLEDGKDLVRAFDGVAKTDAGAAFLMQTPVLGDLVYAAPGETKKKVYRFDPSTWKYVRIE